MNGFKPVGGRGRKAPYNTRIMRVPEPIADKVQTLIDEYRISVMKDEGVKSDKFIIIRLSDLRHIFSDILRQKNGAKVSFEKLEHKLISE